MHPLCIALILYPNVILRILLRIAYASLMHNFDFIPKHHVAHSLTHPLHISLLLNPSIILCILSCASLTHPLRIALFFKPKHHLMHSLAHSLCITSALLSFDIQQLILPTLLRIPYAYAQLTHLPQITISHFSVNFVRLQQYMLHKVLLCIFPHSAETIPKIGNPVTRIC